MGNNYMFEVPEQKKIRLIIHTDCKNEADDQFALAHHLMTPKFIVKGIIAGHFESRPDQGKGLSMGESYREIKKILKLMYLEEKYTVYKGATRPFDFPENFEVEDFKSEVSTIEPILSEGAKFIVEEALREDEKPLYVACLGGVTDIASAYLMEPKIAEKLTVIWIGGGAYPEGGNEFNLSQDILAANILFSSKIPLWQIPKNVYKMMKVSLAELQCKVQPYGKIGDYLFKQMVELNNFLKDSTWPHGESWILGDQPTVSVLLNYHEHDWDWIPAPLVNRDMHYIHKQNNRPIRVYKRIDSRFTLEDFFSKLKINYSGKER
mgnify:CR=1 FL=1